jgi:NAD(P)H-dependent flavin oxidoreductase YrpB (nitropropane dioxygenase family)
LANAFKAIQLATEQGDIEKGFLPVGQIMGLIKDSPKVSELMERIVVQAEEVGQKVAKITITN